VRVLRRARREQATQALSGAMSFLSLQYLSLCLAGAFSLILLSGRARTLCFFAVNAVFAATHLDAAGGAVLAGFCLLGFLSVRLVARDPRWRSAAVVVLVLLFVYLRRYSFLELLLPPSFFTDGLAGALELAGLSFLLFKILHLVIDVAGGAIPGGSVTFGLYWNYCFNFTAFLLGPIQRFQSFEAQWRGAERSIEPGFEAHLDATNRVLRGLVKKFVLAEMVHAFALQSTQDVAAMPLLELIGRTYAFYLFLYCDFSGYCDIVIGSGALIGIRPPENFHLPFFSPNVAEFWLRVHRSLTLWLTDYVFNPLYASALRNPLLARRPLLAMSGALLATMLISGLWHGTTLSFVLFGLVHGLYLIAFRLYEAFLARRIGRKRLKAWRQTWASRVLGTALTFHATAMAYLFFVLDAETLWRWLCG
jgi:D-alanyl-lipoteichoic acid acyltransferase DltB (MBOAT superfamily)